MYVYIYISIYLMYIQGITNDEVTHSGHAKTLALWRTPRSKSQRPWGITHHAADMLRFGTVNDKPAFKVTVDNRPLGSTWKAAYSVVPGNPW